jgi:outer membrane protein assembly factor BamD (BamD/ComL family)
MEIILFVVTIIIIVIVLYNKYDNYLIKKADNGDSKAQYKLGMKNINKQNFVVARDYFEKARQNEHTKAVFRLEQLKKLDECIKMNSGIKIKFKLNFDLLKSIEAHAKRGEREYQF